MSESTTPGQLEQGLLRFINKLDKKSETCIRFFYRSGDFYTCHGNDATFVAKNFFRTMAVLKHYSGGTPDTAYVNVSLSMFESTIRELLLVLQYRVEVYTKEGSSWTLLKKGSPGNVRQFEEDLYKGSELSTSPIVLAINLGVENGQKVIGAAFTDTSSGQFAVCEFFDNDQFSNLEALHVQINAKEVLVAVENNNPDNAKMIKTLERSGMMVTVKRKADFVAKDIVQDLNRLLKTEGASSTLPELDLKRAMSSMACIIKYLELLADDTNFSQYDIKTFDLNQYMRLDAAADRAMNLTPSPLDGSNKTMCLTGLLNKCKTAQGQRLIQRMIKQPLLDKFKIEERQNLVETLIEDTALRSSLQEEHLKKIPDLYRLSRKFLRGQATLSDCVRVCQVVSRLPEICSTLKYCEGDHKALFDETFTSVFDQLNEDFSKYVELIETTLEVDEEEHEVYIKPSYDDDLKRIRDEMDELKSELPDHLYAAAKDLSLVAEKTLKLEQAPHLGYFFRVTLKDEKVIRSKKNKYHTLETQKNGVRFTTAKLSALNESYKTLKAEYDQRQGSLAEEVINIAGGYTEPMETLNEIIAYLDVIVSFADVSVSAPIPYVRPKILEKGSGVIEMEGSRHPCLEVQDDVQFIPNDINLNKDDQRFLIITGPNMGGKSTCIRQIGVIVLMAQIGCFVPCTSATISIVDCILARVGAGDSQLKGVSTLMAEMLETSSILKSATKDSLIIVDELGRGTSTYDGFGLAWAISEHIVEELGSFCLFATHFHELTTLSEKNPAVKNFHVTALTTDSTLTLLYRLKPGFCDQSFGIHVAELANFPEEVIEMAKRKALELEDFSRKENDDKENKDQSKKLRTDDQEEGEKLIENFLNEMVEKKITQLKPKDAMEALKTMKESLLKENNQYVKAIMEAN